MTEVEKNPYRDALLKERDAAITWLRDSLGCTVLKGETSHVIKAVAYSMKLVADFSSNVTLVELESYNLTHTLYGFEFRYTAEHGMCVRSQGLNDFPVAVLRFKKRPLCVSQSAPVFREDEHLMRAGIELHVQIEQAEACIKSKSVESKPCVELSYNEEEKLRLRAGEFSLENIARSVSVEAFFRTREVRISNLVTKWM